MYKYGFCHPSGMHNTISSVYPYRYMFLDKTTYQYYFILITVRSIVCATGINVIDSIEMLALDIRTFRPTVFLMDRK